MVMALEYWDEYLKNKSPSTRQNYSIYFNKFIESTGITAEELYNMQLKAMKSEDPRDKRIVARMVSKFIREMVEEGYHPTTANTVAKAVKSFFVANEINFKIRRDEKPVNVYRGQNLITSDQLREWYYSWSSGSAFRQRNRALMLFLKDSGLRVSDASLLNVEDYLNCKGNPPNDQGERFKAFYPKITQKTSQTAHIHIGPEAITELDEYLEGRESGPLFLARDGSRMVNRAMSNVFCRVSNSTENGGNIRLSAHSIRKFHKTRLSSTMENEWINILQGKSSDVYTRPQDDGSLTRKYVESYDQLRIFGEEDKKNRQRDLEISALKKEVKALKSDLENYEGIVLGVTHTMTSSPKNAQTFAQIQAFLNANGVLMIPSVPERELVDDVPLIKLIDLHTGEELNGERQYQLDEMYTKIFKRSLGSEFKDLFSGFLNAIKTKVNKV